MATPAENAQLIAQLFSPLTASIAGMNDAGVKTEQLNAQDRLRQIKREQELQDEAQQNEYKRGLIQLQTDSAERISKEQTQRIIDAQNETTRRTLEVQEAISKRAEAAQTRKDLTQALAQYRILAGKDAKSISDFGDTPEQQLQGVSVELAHLNDDRSRAVAKVALGAQKEYSDELSRIQTITPKDEPTLVSMALGAVTDKSSLEKLRKLKTAKSDDIITILSATSPQSAAEFSGAYEQAKDAIINQRAKNSRLPILQKNLAAHDVLLQKDPKASEYVALGLTDGQVPEQSGTVPTQQSLDSLFKTPKVNSNDTEQGMIDAGAPAALSTRSGLASPDPTTTLIAPPALPAPPPASGYGGLMGMYDTAINKVGPNILDSLNIVGRTAVAPLAQGLNYLAGGNQRVVEGDAARHAALLELLRRYQNRNATPSFIPAQ